jgi:formyltetrahydrofolate deformylase
MANRISFKLSERAKSRTSRFANATAAQRTITNESPSWQACQSSLRTKPSTANRATMKKFATITVIGKDKTGVVAKITNFLFLQKANIEALEEQVTRGQFSMTLQTSWQEMELARDTVSSGLARLARDLEMEIKVRFTQPTRRQRMALMVTKETHCFQKLVKAINSGELKKAEPALVLSNRPDLEPLARKARLPFIHVPWGERLKAEQQALILLDRPSN